MSMSATYFMLVHKVSRSESWSIVIEQNTVQIEPFRVMRASLDYSLYI